MCVYVQMNSSHASTLLTLERVLQSQRTSQRSMQHSQHCQWGHNSDMQVVCYLRRVGYGCTGAALAHKPYKGTMCVCELTSCITDTYAGSGMGVSCRSAIRPAIKVCGASDATLPAPRSALGDIPPTDASLPSPPSDATGPRPRCCAAGCGMFRRLKTSARILFVSRADMPRARVRSGRLSGSSQKTVPGGSKG